MNYGCAPARLSCLLSSAIALLLGLTQGASAQNADRVKILFLGDHGHHNPAARFAQLQPALKERGLDLTYTDKMSDLNPETLNAYDGLMIYSNETKISPEQEKALVDYVRAGHGFIPLHCASYCFLNSPRYISLVGGQFQKHKTGTFETRIVDPSHSIMAGFKPFKTWDETYVHTKIGPDIHLLQVRPENVEGGQGGDGQEPWTWVRTEGKGRVFYTAYGHDQRTFSNPGFVDLIERGTRWATRHDAASAFDHPRMAGPDPSAKPFEYVKAEGVPFYDPNSRVRNGGGVWNQMQKPLSPEESQKHMILPEGFETKLFASEPDIIKPITMAWDERGRLWVSESVDYPNRVTEPGKGSDRIKICEDTDGDGKADKFTIFAEGLNIPFSITFWNGGIIIHERKSTWFLKDTDGDGKADVKKELFTGWYPRGLDTHAGPSNLRYGLDNWIWGMVGYGSFGGTVGGKSMRFSQGFYRFKPDGSTLEFLRSTSNNTWGIGFSDEGIVFGSTANGCPSVYLPIPNRYYESVQGFSPQVLRMISDSYMFHSPNPKVRQVDFHGGYTAAAGHALYTARVYPKEYWNRTAFVAEPTGHIVGTFVLEREGSDFKSHNPFNLLGSMDEWTAPIMAEVGPDGLVWVIDWYAYIVQHNPTPVGYRTGPGAAYETPRRDHEHGRIYRITYSGGKPGKVLDLSKASPDELVQTLKNDNQFWRKHAQRLLVEKQDKGVIPALIQLVNDTSVDEIGLNVGAIHALWTLKGLGALEGENADALAAAYGALKHPSAGVRRNAVQVLPFSEKSLETILADHLLDDSDAQVRLMTLLAVADMPSGNAASNQAGPAIYAMLRRAENITDRWIPDAAVAAAAKHDAAFLNGALADSARHNAGKPTPPPPTAAKSAEPKAASNLLANPSFEEASGDRPAGWRPATYGGEGTFTLDPSVTHSGSHSVKITSTRGGDVGWSQEVAVKPNTRYRLSAWVKTKGLNAGQSMGALFNVHQLQQEGIPRALKGDNDWTQLTGEFATGSLNSITINLLFGGWGRARGEAWWDDVQLIELGPGGPISLSSASNEGGADAKLAQIVQLVTRHYAGRAPADSIVATLAALKGADPKLAESVLDGLVAGWPDKSDAAPSLSDADRTAIADLGKALPAEQRDRLLVLANRWGQGSLFAGQMEEILKTVKATIASDTASAGDRADAAKRLLRLSDDPASADAILAPVSPQSSGELAKGLILALADSRSDATAGEIIKKWNDFTPASRAAAANVLMRRVPWTLALLHGIQEKKLARNDLSTSDWQLLKAHREREIAGLARRLDTVQTDPNRQKVLDAMLPALQQKGDVAAGQKVFTTLCAQCHTFNGQGGKVGPELSGIAARDPKEILADIVDPNRSVEANYRMWTIETKDGDSYSGRLDTETQTTVEMLDATGERHVIARKDIQSMNASTLSVMPVGLIDPLKPADVASLMEFLKTGHAEKTP
ncbi:MAG TPA: PVC-type heme-binding CxxCH protein [Tepidisphaeraceae bacterium]